MTDLEKKMLAEERNRASADFGTGSLLMRPEDSSIQKASEDFMGYLNNPTAEMMPPAEPQSAPEVPAQEPTPDINAELEKLKMEMSAKNSNVGFIPAPKVPLNIPQEDILAQLKAARDANEVSMGAAKAADKSTELGNLIMRSGSMAGEGFVNRAGNTNIKLTPEQAIANKAAGASFAGKGKLEALMQDYGIKKGMEDTAYNRAKDEQARKDKLSERAEDREYKNKMLEATQTKAKQDTYLNKEEVKEDIQIKKENRKVRKELDSAIPLLESQLQNIKDAKDLLKQTSTGPIDQYTSKLTDAGQKLEQKLNKISLDTMVKMFSGMSKAVDTNAERAQFQSTQPSMSNYENVNKDTLEALEKSVKSLIEKTNKSKQLYDRTGDFTQPEEKQSTVAPKAVAQSAAPYGDTVDRNGKTYKWNASAGKYQPIQ